jgi:excisionase family DNA binding protein
MTEPQPNFPTLWKVGDVCRYLGFSKSWVYARVDDGTLPHLTIGGSLRFKPEAIQTWAERQGKQPKVIPFARKEDRHG